MFILDAIQYVWYYLTSNLTEEEEMSTTEEHAPETSSEPRDATTEGTLCDDTPLVLGDRTDRSGSFRSEGLEKLAGISHDEGSNTSWRGY
jgi:hypothetical protein